MTGARERLDASGTVDLVVVATRAVVEEAGPPGGAAPAGAPAPVERPATVVVDGGRVVAVLPGPGTGHTSTHADPAPAARDVVTLGDDEVLLPGVVDTHVHVNEPGRTAWEGFATATRAAALGGVTTVVDMPLNSVPPTVDVAALQAKREAARRQAAVDVGFWGGAVPASLGRLTPLHEAGVFGFKAFLVDSGVPEFPPLDPAGLRDALAEVAALGSVLVVHAEDPDVLAGAPAAAGPRFADFVASRPSAAEVRAVERVVDAAREADARVHVLHVASGDALAVLAAARRDGVAVTAETCPHYLTLTADAVPDGATEFKCCPPIRGRRDRDLLWEGLTGGVLDVVVSDHSPCTPDLKRREAGDFAEAWGGIASLQLGLPLVWTAARERGLTLADVSRWMARRPAELFGIPGKGRIAPGADADLVVLAPDATFRVDPGRLAHRHPVTPYAGRELAGVVRRVWLRGVPVGPTAEPEAPPSGRLLRKPSPAGADQAQDAS